MCGASGSPPARSLLPLGGWETLFGRRALAAFPFPGGWLVEVSRHGLVRPAVLLDPSGLSRALVLPLPFCEREGGVLSLLPRSDVSTLTVSVVISGVTFL